MSSRILNEPDRETKHRPGLSVEPILESDAPP